MREVPIATFAAAHSDGAVVVDVREPGEYVAGHVPGAALLPMGELSSRLHELPRDVPIYVICASGNRSLAMTSFLMRAGHRGHRLPARLDRLPAADSRPVQLRRPGPGAPPPSRDHPRRPTSRGVGRVAH
ncbi:MAG: rhodanese-like domain-containing protein [Dermatophilaceae bacterium]|nr:rhodanese-like domain-containing protein [Dermatophilaceae bacterium]